MRKLSLAAVSALVLIAALSAVIAAMLLWLGPFSVPSWAVVTLLLVLFPLGIVLSVKRMRTERRLAQTLWRAATRR